MFVLSPVLLLKFFMSSATLVVDQSSVLRSNASCPVLSTGSSIVTPFESRVDVKPCKLLCANLETRCSQRLPKSGS